MSVSLHKIFDANFQARLVGNVRGDLGLWGAHRCLGRGPSRQEALRSLAATPHPGAHSFPSNVQDEKEKARWLIL